MYFIFRYLLMYIIFRQGYKLEDFDFEIDKPLKQTLTPEPGKLSWSSVVNKDDNIYK